MPFICVVVGLAMSIYAMYCLRAGYVYLDWKLSFTEDNRIYRDSNPIWFWFGILDHGSLGAAALGLAVYGYLFHR
jgi:hypothetical protein